MKKRIIAVIACICVLCLISACGGKETFVVESGENNTTTVKAENARSGSGGNGYVTIAEGQKLSVKANLTDKSSISVKVLPDILEEIFSGTEERVFDMPAGEYMLWFEAENRATGDLYVTAVDTAEATTDYGTSNLYTEEDMDNAITLIKNEFASWEGCELHSISYAGDDCNSEANIKWMNELGEGKNYTQCIEFLSDFHSPKNGGGAWNPDEEYKNWQWWLAREDGGDWELLTWGY